MFTDLYYTAKIDLKSFLTLTERQFAEVAMRGHICDNQQTEYSCEDLSLLQKGRSLHDRAVYEGCCRMLAEVRSFLGKLNLLSASGNQVDYEEDAQVPSVK